MRLVFADRGIHTLPMEYKWFAWILLLAYMIVDMYVTRVLPQWHQRTWPQTESTFFSGWSLSREYQYQFAGSYTIVCTSNMEVPSTKQNGSQCFAEKLLTCSESLRPGAERKYMEEVLCSLSLAHLKPWYWSRSFIRDVNGNTWTDVSLSGGFVV